LEEQEMKVREQNDFSDAELEREILNNSDDLLEFCGVCFIALGSQEKRIYRRKEAFHVDCVAKVKS